MLFVISLVCLNLSFIISSLFGFNLYYIVLLQLVASTFISFFQKGFNINKYLILISFCLLFSALLSFNIRLINTDGLFEMLFLYFQAIAILNYKFNRKEKLFLLDSLIATGLFCTLGVVLYYFNFIGGVSSNNDIFVEQYVNYDNNMVLRNSSFYGSALVSSGILFISILACFFKYLISRNNLYLYIAIILIIGFMACLTRRQVIPLIVATFFIYATLTQRVKVISIVAFSLVLIFFIAQYPQAILISIDRLFLNLVNLTSNADSSRLILLSDGLAAIFTNPLGYGPGSMSNIGKETETILQSTGLITITESFYLTFIGEVGLIFCLPIFYALYLSLKSLSKRYFYIVALPLLLECVVGLGLLNPIISYMSFLLIKVAHEKKYQINY